MTIRIFAAFFGASVLLGLSQAYFSCGSDGKAHCVKAENCVTKFAYRSNSFQTTTTCPFSTVCCHDESINLTCGPNGIYKCLTNDLCQTPYKDFSTKQFCPTNFVCCRPTKKIDLSINDPL
ncbi:uncharacterized protein LOC108140452 [Drosophila elegans]|uniref:uncharacterized protein LOC108140452 n=1 Tax=Drosophila elegans TaxID=30023 RepID=UPI0007E63CD3|nr:uncharacterized protein LOC108140452 [Drosophila elegans]